MQRQWVRQWDISLSTGRTKRRSVPRRWGRQSGSSLTWTGPTSAKSGPGAQLLFLFSLPFVKTNLISERCVPIYCKKPIVLLLQSINVIILNRFGKRSQFTFPLMEEAQMVQQHNPRFQDPYSLVKPWCASNERAYFSATCVLIYYLMLASIQLSFDVQLKPSSIERGG